MTIVNLSPVQYGIVNSTPACVIGSNFVAGGAESKRCWLKFDLSSIPEDSTINNVTLEFTVTGASTTGSVDINPYGTDGGIDPDVHSCSLKRSQIAVATPYINNSTAFASTGAKSVDLGATADGHVQDVVAQPTIRDYSLGFKRETSETNPAVVAVDAVLIIDYTSIQEITPDPVKIAVNVPEPLVTVDKILTPDPVKMVMSVPAVIAGPPQSVFPDPVKMVMKVTTPIVSRSFDPDLVAGRVGIGLVTRGKTSTKTGDADATPTHLIVQSGTSLVGIGLDRDGSPWLSQVDEDLAGSLSGAGVNLPELIFPRPFKLTKLLVATKNMNESRGDQWSFKVFVNESETAWDVAGRIKSNGLHELLINQGVGWVHRVMVQVNYTNTDQTIRAKPCSISRIELKGRPRGER